jgi:O-antigen/teichoic acid export membrane protein
MGAEERGLYALLVAGSGFLLLLGSLGVVNTANVLIADPRQNLSVRRYAVLADRLTAIIAVALIPTSAIIVLIYVDSPTWLLFALFAGYCVLALQAAFHRTGLHGWSRHRLAFGAEVASGVFLLLGAFVVVRYGRLTVLELVALGSIAFLIQTFIARVAFRRASSPEEAAGGDVTLRELLGASLATLGFTVGGWIASRGDRLVLGLVSDNTQVGIYSAAATLGEVPWLVAATMATVLGTRLAASQDPGLVGLFRLRAVAGTGLVVLFIAPSGYWVLTSFLGNEFRSGVPALVLMCLAALLLASSQIDLAACLALGDRSSGSRVSLVGAGVMVCSAAALGGPWGATGCAVASLITYAVMAWLSHRASRRNISKLGRTQPLTTRKAG